MSWDGLLLINKPEGETSHTIVQIIKERVGVGKAGHLGTLDPLATGVFPVCLGKSTRLTPFYMGADKCYLTAIRFGYFTKTDDREGMQEGPRMEVKIRKDDLEEMVGSLIGDYNQRPPAYSAKKVKGKKAYELARKGIETDLPPQKVRIHDARLIDLQRDIAVIFIHCASGTYVRSIARDLGTRLRCGAHVYNLQRTKFNQFTIEQTCAPTVSLEKLRASFIPLDKMLPDFPQIVVDSEESRKVKTGGKIERDEKLSSDWVRIFNPDHILLAFGKTETTGNAVLIQPKIVFPE